MTEGAKRNIREQRQAMLVSTKKSPPTKTDRPDMSKQIDNKAVLDAEPEASWMADDQVMELVETNLQCSICKEVFIKAITLNCGHTFCKFCISKWQQGQYKCPLCRTKIWSTTPTSCIDKFIEKVFKRTPEDVQLSRQEAINVRQIAARKTRRVSVDLDTSNEDDNLYLLRRCLHCRQLDHRWAACPYRF